MVTDAYSMEVRMHRISSGIIAISFIAGMFWGCSETPESGLTPPAEGDSTATSISEWTKADSLQGISSGAVVDDFSTYSSSGLIATLCRQNRRRILICHIGIRAHERNRKPNFERSRRSNSPETHHESRHYWQLVLENFGRFSRKTSDRARSKGQFNRTDGSLGIRRRIPGNILRKGTPRTRIIAPRTLPCKESACRNGVPSGRGSFYVLPRAFRQGVHDGYPVSGSSNPSP